MPRPAASLISALGRGEERQIGKGIEPTLAGKQRRKIQNRKNQRAHREYVVDTSVTIELTGFERTQDQRNRLSIRADVALVQGWALAS